MINEMLAKQGITSEFVRGKRVTDKPTVQIVEAVLSGLVNKRIVQAINSQGGRAVGISGKDGNLMLCDQTDPELGYVGTPAEVDTSVLKTLFDAEMIPVIAPLGTGRTGETMNVNGDTAAGAIAASLATFRAGIREETSPIQVWPHHFDLSMIWLPGDKVPGEDPDDEESADRQMNFGFTYGDDAVPEPYLYVTAYPRPAWLGERSLPEPAEWHAEGAEVEIK